MIKDGRQSIHAIKEHIRWYKELAEQNEKYAKKYDDRRDVQLMYLCIVDMYKSRINELEWVLGL